MEKKRVFVGPGYIDMREIWVKNPEEDPLFLRSQHNSGYYGWKEVEITQELYDRWLKAEDEYHACQQALSEATGIERF